MIPFDYFTLAAVVAELQALLIGARVQKVQQPSANDILLSTFGPHGAHRLLLTAEPQRARLHLTQRKRPNPVTPPGFCQVARKDLEGAWVEEIRLPYPDRVVELRFRTVEGQHAFLIAELMGRNANVFLTRGDGTLRGVLRPAPESTRPLRPGATYTPPPGIGEGGLGRFAQAEADARPDGLAALHALVAAGEFAPHSIQDENGHTVGVWAFEPLSVPTDRRFPRESVSVALDTLYGDAAQETNEHSERTALVKAIDRERAFREKSLASIQRTLDESTLAPHDEESGNLLLAALGQLQKGQAEAQVPDFYADDPTAVRTITLDPKKSPQENAESYFARARKRRDAADYAEGKRADLDDELAQLAALAEQAATAPAESLPTLQRALTTLAPRAQRPAEAKRPTEHPFDGHKVKTYVLGGYTLYVGENATANDYLLTRVAAPTDFWFHVRSATGAHGVLRTNQHPERVPDPVLRQAAAIVAARSGTEKHARLVPVDYTQRRYVRKPRGAKPGQALYTTAKTIDVEPRLP